MVRGSPQGHELAIHGPATSFTGSTTMLWRRKIAARASCSGMPPASSVPTFALHSALQRRGGVLGSPDGARGLAVDADGHDYEPGVGVDRIVSKTLYLADAGRNRVLHDGGGTVEDVPRSTGDHRGARDGDRFVALGDVRAACAHRRVRRSRAQYAGCRRPCADDGPVLHAQEWSGPEVEGTRGVTRRGR